MYILDYLFEKGHFKCFLKKRNTDKKLWGEGRLTTPLSPLLWRACDKVKETGIHGYLYDFSVDYNSVNVVDTFDIHKNLMEKNNIHNVWIYLKK